MATERTDPLAATYAEMSLYPLMSREKAKTVVDRYVARIEHRDGQRRVVLYGEWEIDPAATARYVPKADAA